MQKEDKLIDDRLPQFQQKGKLIPKACSMHLAPLIATLILAGSIGISTYFYLIEKLPLWGYIMTVIGGYITYLMVGVFCNTAVKYLENQRGFEEYENIYREMVNSKPNFQFQSHCYHYETTMVDDTRVDENGHIEHYQRANTEKVQTYDDYQTLFPVQWQDCSEKLYEIPNASKLVFFKYISKYEFISPQDQKFYNKSFQTFKLKNKKDSHQDTKAKYVLPNHIPKVAFVRGPHQGHAGFYIWGMLGLVYLYCIFKETQVLRYEITILKKIKF